ncbi:MAG: D-tyrosyl-tRNA(Tyr) deacylase [Candidatus Latescibacteria bacterium]|nr:D-tyrosyl-tRNA(Tyr) deacylase [Candidatus Latescibacterota bacterium]NIM22164.1 D-tyrosyl-tRNA(Tyr) deacylase [Candidatus Latescibacterota bacterium]NIM64714.1 D-tyrosyl-tRNA(Tyr) deacylase [Candidatus Latescibacterota bacterium]NIO01224.1 D-tyrosyl-tRNA(Tyr) deacylase [Candidatus Latescibacterota bacterium]NIO27609.1 D-tyrosyl-tRNA(Tyr) deacylase [Candidatus Latescibacterota bacterium]
MRAVLQRVSEASVAVGGREISRIGRGFLVLIGFTRSDCDEVLQWMAQKISSLRLFEDEAGKMNCTLEEVGGEILAVSQFTLYGDCRKGRRPSFDKSAPPEQAEMLYEKFIDILKREAPCPVAAGVFREHMHVSLVNDGPVTLMIEKEAGA